MSRLGKIKAHEETFDFRWTQEKNINMETLESASGKRLLGFAKIEVPSGWLAWNSRDRRADAIRRPRAARLRTKHKDAISRESLSTHRSGIQGQRLHLSLATDTAPLKQ